jgi:hypothetical protein
MKDIEQLNKLIEDDKVKYGINLPKDLGKKFVLGHTKYAVRYGILSDGHEKITDAQRYFQANKEMYVRACSIVQHRANAMQYQADYLDAIEMPENTESERLRKEAKLLVSKNAVTRSLVEVQGLMSELEELDSVRRELEPIVMTRYPEGIEQAELDNWVAIAKYRQIKGEKRRDNLILPPEVKAELGIYMNNPEMFAPLMVNKEEEIRSLPSGSINEFLQNKQLELTKETV